MLKDTKQTKASSRSRSGTTVTTIPEENELYHESTEDYYDDDDDIDDTDNIIFTEEGRRRETPTDVAVGGGAAVAAASFTSDLDDRFNWISPHSSDSVFSDFDLDAIVKDYEKLQRRINFRPGTGGGNDYNNNSGGDNNNGGADDDANKINNNAGDGGNNHSEHPMTNMGINVRYRNMKKIWLSNFPRTHGLVFRVFLPLYFYHYVYWSGVR